MQKTNEGAQGANEGATEGGATNGTNGSTSNATVESATKGTEGTSRQTATKGNAGTAQQKGTKRQKQPEHTSLRSLQAAHRAKRIADSTTKKKVANKAA